MRRALEYVKAFDGVIAQHAQEPRLTEGAQMNEGALSGELGLAGWPAVAEESIIARDVLLAEHVGSRLHVCHVSTAGSVDVIRWAKAPRHRRHRRGHAAPPAAHRRAGRGYDAALQGQPAAAPREDVEALRAGLADGTIDIVATDHAPHPDRGEGLRVGCGRVRHGRARVRAVGRPARPWSRTGCSAGPTSPGSSRAPRPRIGRLAGHGGPLAAGAPADLILYDPTASRTFATADLARQGRQLAVPRAELPGRVVATFHHGLPDRPRRRARSRPGRSRVHVDAPSGDRRDRSRSSRSRWRSSSCCMLAGWRVEPRQPDPARGYPRPPNAGRIATRPGGRPLRRHHARR